MINIKKFRSFLENNNQDFFAPEESTTITDKDEIVEILGKLDGLQRPFFSTVPKHKNRQGEPVRIITQSEIDIFVKYIMRNPVRETGKVGTKIGIPDKLHFSGRKSAEIWSIVEMTGISSGWVRNYEDFMIGNDMFKREGGVWYAHENILKYPWSVRYGIREIEG
jgi:hypothetical protein